MANSADYRSKCLSEKEERCVACGSEKLIVVHHKDGNRSNDRIENLVPVCRGCHSKVHNGSRESDTIELLQMALNKGSEYEADNLTPYTIRLSKELVETLELEAEENGFGNRTSYIRWIIRNRHSAKTNTPEALESRLNRVELRLDALEES